MNILSSICLLTLILIVWFKTSAFVEYCELFKLSKYFKVDQYIDLKDDLTFPEFLKEYYNNFLTRLLSCPICAAIWGAILISTCLNIFMLFPIVCVFGLCLYLLVIKLL
jgi:hypothetical protein